MVRTTNPSLYAIHLPISIKRRFMLATHNLTGNFDKGKPFPAFRFMFKTAIETKKKE
jgi:hypothetical protein